MTMTDIIELAQNLYDASVSGRRKYSSALALQLGNIGYREICREAKCGILTNDSFTTVDGQREYNYPVGYSMMVMVEYQDSNNYRSKLRPIYQKDIVDDYGYPLRYYLNPTKMGLDPMPDGVYTINRYFYQGPSSDLTETDSLSLIPADFHYVLAYYIVYQFFKIDKGDTTGGLQKWGSFYLEELLKLKNYINEQQNQDSFIPVG